MSSGRNGTPKDPEAFWGGGGGSPSGALSTRSMLSPRSGMKSRINRSGGAGCVTKDEANHINAEVRRRQEILEDEEELARLSRELAEQAKLGMLDSASEEEDDTIMMHKARSRRLSASEQTSQPPPPPQPTLPPTAEPLMEHAFSCGGEADADALGSDGCDVTFQEPSCVTVLPDGELCVADTKVRAALRLATPCAVPGDRTCTPRAALAPHSSRCARTALLARGTEPGPRHTDRTKTHP